MSFDLKGIFISKKTTSTWEWWNFGRKWFNTAIIIVFILGYFYSELINCRIFYPGKVIIDIFLFMFVNIYFTIGVFLEKIFEILKRTEMLENIKTPLKLFLAISGIIFILFWVLSASYFFHCN
jgi:hypothetical protein